jgi:hypothetical protein
LFLLASDPIFGVLELPQRRFPSPLQLSGYQAVVRFDEIRDGNSNTILVIETGNSGINWMEPRDYPIEQAIRSPASPSWEARRPLARRA